MFLGQPNRKYQALPNPQYYIKNSKKEKEKSDSLWFRDPINPKEWFEPRERKYSWVERSTSDFIGWGCVEDGENF